MQYKTAPGGQAKKNNPSAGGASPADEPLADSRILIGTQITRTGMAIAQEIGAIVSTPGRADRKADAKLEELVSRYEKSDAGIKDKISVLARVVQYCDRKENKKTLGSSAKKSHEALAGQIQYLSEQETGMSAQQKVETLLNIPPAVALVPDVMKAVSLAYGQQMEYIGAVGADVWAADGWARDYVPYSIGAVGLGHAEIRYNPPASGLLTQEWAQDKKRDDTAWPSGDTVAPERLPASMARMAVRYFEAQLEAAMAMGKSPNANIRILAEKLKKSAQAALDEARPLGEKPQERRAAHLLLVKYYHEHLQPALAGMEREKYFDGLYTLAGNSPWKNALVWTKEHAQTGMLWSAIALGTLNPLAGRMAFTLMGAREVKIGVQSGDWSTAFMGACMMTGMLSSGLAGRIGGGMVMGSAGMGAVSEIKSGFETGFTSRVYEGMANNLALLEGFFKARMEMPKEGGQRVKNEGKTRKKELSKMAPKKTEEKSGPNIRDEMPTTADAKPAGDGENTGKPSRTSKEQEAVMLTREDGQKKRGTMTSDGVAAGPKRLEKIVDEQGRLIKGREIVGGMAAEPIREANQAMAGMLKRGILHNVKNVIIGPRNVAEILLFDESLVSNAPGLKENLQAISKSGRRMASLFDELVGSKKTEARSGQTDMTRPQEEAAQKAAPRNAQEIISDMEQEMETTRNAINQAMPMLEKMPGIEDMEMMIEHFKTGEDKLGLALNELKGSPQMQVNNIALTLDDAIANSNKDRKIGVEMHAYRLVLDGAAIEPVRLDEANAPVDYNPLMVRGIVENLISNAERYGTSIGSVEIVVGINDVKIRVSDDGPGLSADMAAHAFDYRTKLKNRTEGSTGVGLWYCKWAAEQMNGTIRFTDLGPGYGGRMTTVEVSLPLAKTAPPPDSAPGAGTPGGIPDWLVPDRGRAGGVAAQWKPPEKIIDENGRLIQEWEIVAGRAAEPGRGQEGYAPNAKLDFWAVTADDRAGLEKWIAAKPDDAQAHVLLGKTKLALANRDIYGAAMDAHEAIRLGSEDIGAYYVAYDAELGINNFHLAYRFAERGLRECQNPDPTTRQSLEKRFESLKTSCIDEPERYLTLRPLEQPAKDLHDCITRAIYYSGRAETVQKPALLSQSIRYWDEAIERVKNGEGFNRMESSLTLADLYAERAYESEKWASLEPGRARAHLQKAAEDYRQALALDPGNKRFARKAEEIDALTKEMGTGARKAPEIGTEQQFEQFSRSNHLELKKTAKGYEVSFRTMFVDEDFGLVPDAKIGPFMENYAAYLQVYPDLPIVRDADGFFAPPVYCMEGFGQAFSKWEDAHPGLDAVDYLAYLNNNGLEHHIEARMEVLRQVLDVMGVSYDKRRIATRLRGSNVVFSIPVMKASKHDELVVKFKPGLEEHIAAGTLKALGRKTHKVAPAASMTMMDRIEGITLAELERSGSYAQGRLKIGDIRPGGKYYESYVEQLISWMADYGFTGVQDASPRNFMISPEGEGIVLKGLDFEGFGYSRPLDARTVAQMHGIDLSDPKIIELARKSYTTRWAQLVRKFKANKEDIRHAYEQWLDNPRAVRILKANSWLGGPEFYDQGTDGIIKTFEQKAHMKPNEAWKEFAGAGGGE